MKVINLPKQQVVIEGSILIPRRTITLVGYRHQGKPIAGAKVLGYFDCSFTQSLKGAPSYVGGDFSCSDTKIESLHGVHKQIKHIGGTFYISRTVKSHVMGVMLIKGVQEIVFVSDNAEQDQVEKIINKHLGGNRNIHLAQEELIETGLAEYAKL